jgi:hypothetical protein
MKLFSLITVDSVNLLRNLSILFSANADIAQARYHLVEPKTPQSRD